MPLTTKVLLRLYRFTLIAYPRAFREENSNEMIDTIQERLRDIRSRFGALHLGRFWVRELFAAIRSGLRMRMAENRTRRVSRLATRPPRPGGDSVILSVLQDIKFAARSFRKTPALTSVVIITLALGIGANAAVLPFLHGILIRPLPFEEPGRLAVLFENAPGFTRATPSFSNFVDWRDRSRNFDDLGAYSGISGTLTGVGEPERLTGCRVSHSLFDVLGARPAYGRLFLPDDDVPEAPATVVLSHGLWQRQYGSDPALVGEDILIDGESHTVIGIVAGGFRFPDSSDFWVPYRLSTTTARRGGGAGVIGRLHPDASFERAQEEMTVIAAQLAQEYPATNAQRGIVVRPFADDLLWGHKRPVIIFYAVACIVLLLACANVTNLLMARSTQRRQEIAMRAVLGASRFRIARQLITESLVLASLGGALGVLLGSWGRSVALAAMPNALPYYLRFDMGLPVVFAIVGITVLSGVLFSIVPAIGIRHRDLSVSLRDGAMRAGGERKTSRIRSALVVSEIGLALVVLIGATLLTRSFLSLTAVDAGFDSENLLTVNVRLPRDEYASASAQREFYRAARERIESMAGVVGVTGVSNLPMTGSHQRSSIYAEHTPIPPQGEEDFALGRNVFPGYFETIGIPLVTGRDFSEVDIGPDSPPLVIVDAALAEHLWPNEIAVGKRIKYGAAHQDRWPWMEVIGVVGNTHHFALDDMTEKGMYRPFWQEPGRNQTILIRTAGDPLLLAGQVRRQIWAIDPNIPLDQIRAMDSIVRDTYAAESAQMWLLSVLSSIAIALSAFGVYGVVTYSVGQRTREFGIRMALGAARLEIARLVARQVGRLAFVGLACGVIAALMTTRFGSGLLYEISYTDPITYCVAVMGMSLVIVIAGYVPARRASSLDPSATLRD